MKDLKLKSSQIDYAIVFLMVVMSAGISFLGATIFRVFLLLLVVGVIILRKKSIQLHNFKFLLLFYVVWAASVVFYFNVNLITSGQLLTYLSFFTLVLASYYAVVAVNDFFKTYIKVIYHLAIISFFFYAIQLINLDLLIGILRSFDWINSLVRDKLSRPSIVIFTYGTDAGEAFRNYGFATEPGEFSVFLVLALMLQVSINNFKIDRIVKVLILAILTTFSTSGYIGLVIFIIYMLVNKKGINLTKLSLITLGIPAIFVVANLDFVSEKVTESVQSEVISYEMAHYERTTPGRFGSLLLDISDFRKNPMIGYGIHNDTRYINYGGIEQQRTNGVSDYLATFGLLGFLIMFYNFHRTFKVTGLGKNTKNSIILISAIVVVTFSQVILTSTFFLALQFYHFQIKKLPIYYSSTGNYEN